VHAERNEGIHNVQQLLRAYALYNKDDEYVVQDDKILIVDEFTGRLMPGRRFSEGLHSALEAKEGVRIEAETQTYATITLQNLFRMYKKLAGMTGTAETEAGEFHEIYKLDVMVIPPTWRSAVPTSRTRSSAPSARSTTRSSRRWNDCTRWGCRCWWGHHRRGQRDAQPPAQAQGHPPQRAERAPPPA